MKNELLRGFIGQLRQEGAKETCLYSAGAFELLGCFNDILLFCRLLKCEPSLCGDYDEDLQSMTRCVG